MKILVVVRERAETGEIEKMLQRIVPISEADQDDRDDCRKVIGIAGDGKTGYEMIRRECPDLVLADVELPEMGGLEMLEKLRGDHSDVKAVLLAEKEDFSQAKRAIDLGVEGYLVKPVREDELRQAVVRAGEKLKREHMAEAVLSIENIFLACLNGQLSPDPDFNMMTRQRFGFTVEEPGAVFAVWLGDSFEEQKEYARSVIEQSKDFGAGRASRVFEARAWKILFVVLYQMENEEREYTYFQKEIVPKLCQQLLGTVVCIWAKAERIVDLPDVLKHMNFMKDWNLLFDRGEIGRASCRERV